eukprot:EG_transcript_15121
MSFPSLPLRLPTLLLLLMVHPSVMVLEGSANPKVIMAYSLKRGGFCNQLYSMLHCMLIASSFKWDYELPELLYHTNPEKEWGKKKFHTAPLTKVLDVTKMQAAFLKRGMLLYFHGSTGPTNDIQWVKAPVSGPLFQWRMVARDHVRRYMNTSRLPIKLIYVNPGPGDIVIGPTEWPLFRALVHDLHFAPEVQALADRVLQQLTAPHPRFNGLHLRIERDFIYHPGLLHDDFFLNNCAGDSMRCLKKAYLPVLLEERTSRPYYVASGVFSIPMKIKPKVLSLLQQVAPTWNYSTQFLSAAEVKGLLYEQLAAVDLVVLAHCDVFVGMPESTFSTFVSLYRASKGLLGRDRFVDKPSAMNIFKHLPHLGLADD